MDKKCFLLSFVWILLLFSSCDDNRELSKALRLSGPNRPELQKVLDHYSTEVKDELKYKAAVYLIENMPGHFSFRGEGIKEFYNEAKAVLMLDSTRDYKLAEIERISSTYIGITDNFVSDLEIITADFLISNIDQAFDTWENEVAAQHLTFEQFCEYLLPYKTAELQQLDNWREVLSVKFDDEWKTTTYNTVQRRSTFWKGVYINRGMKNSIWSFDSDVGYSGIPLYSAYGMSDFLFGDCEDYAVIATSVLRSHGLPSVIEYTPLLGWESAGHVWYTLFTDKGVHLPYTWGFMVNPGDVFFPERHMPKIFRSTYKANKDALKFANKAKSRWLRVDPFSKDVTSEYIATSNLEIPVNEKGLKDKYVYICTTNTNSWIPVHYGTVRGGKARFKDMGRNIMYVIMGFDGTGLVPISEPFLLKSSGDIEYIKFDLDKRGEVYLTRKFHTRENVGSIMARMIGGEIQASDFADFRTYETLYRVDSLIIPDQVRLSPSKSYRYWRYAGAPGTYGDISEVQFFEPGSDKPIYGKYLGMDGASGMEIGKAFDGDWLTSYNSTQANDAWIGMDYGKGVNIDRVRLVPRSDDNNIHHGDEHELFYWDNAKWVSLGKQTAEEKYLVYSDVPVDAILWLKNLSRGKDQRIFRHIDGKQEFW